VELERVRLHLSRNEATFTTAVESPNATSSPATQAYSEGEFLITLAVPIEVCRRIAGVDPSSGDHRPEDRKASTDPPPISFSNGTGKCVGAIYDPGHEGIADALERRAEPQRARPQWRR